MEDRIKELLDKYWEAETTLSEEQELKDLLEKVEGFTEEKTLFQGLGQLKAMEPSIDLPKKSKVRKLTPVWLNWAASILIVASSVWVWQRTEQRKAEEQAYQEVMMALALIQTNFSKGQESLRPMDDLKYLNTTEQIFNLEKK